jgi:hypothetical protein
MSLSALPRLNRKVSRRELAVSLLVLPVCPIAAAAVDIRRRSGYKPLYMLGEKCVASICVSLNIHYHG